MAKTILNEDSTIKVNLSNESNLSVNMSVDSTNYIPGYKEAEEQRRKNEEQRIANEIERENYFEDMQEKVESGYFNGEPGSQGPVGPPGEPGYTPIKGVDYFDGQDGKDGQDAPKYTAGTNIEITEDNVINCTATGGGGTLTEELDPTVPTHVKNITEADIEKWNSGTSGSGFDGDYNNLTNKPTELSQFNNDVGYITDYTESDPTVPKHVKDITEGNITSWNNKAEASAIPTNLSQLTNDSGFVTEDTNTTYTLSKDGSTVKLTGSDGSSSEVTVTEGGGGSSITVDSALSSTSTNPVQNKVVNGALSGKQNKVLSGAEVPSNSTGSNGDVYLRTGTEVVLYSSSTGTQGNITLNDYLTNYTRVDFIGGFHEYQSVVTIYPVSTTIQVMVFFDWHDGTSGVGRFGSRYLINGKTLTYGSSYRTYQYSGGNMNFDTNNSVTIFKVIGYK